MPTDRLYWLWTAFRQVLTSAAAALEDLAYGRETGREEYAIAAERSFAWLFPEQAGSSGSTGEKGDDRSDRPGQRSGSGWSAPAGNVMATEGDDVNEMAIEVDGLRRSYGRFEAVRGVSFQVRRGELFALLGTNGAGKTTTIEVLEGLQASSAGRVSVLGMNPVRDRSAVRERTGVMLQSGGFTGALTVRETVQIWRSLTARPLPTAEVVELVGLGERVGVAVEQLSGGERRRLELALAVLGRPELLFLDEPTTGMDPVSRRYTWDLIGALRDRGTTVLLTTHYLEEADEFADQVAIMQAGRIVTSGTPAEVVGALPGRISFGVPDDERDLPALAGVAATVVGTRVTYRSTQVQADLHSLLAWANANHLVLRGLSAGPATLEDVFLGIADDDVADDRVRAEAGR